MKYKRMLCWVRPHEKRELEKAVSGQFPLEFTKNYDDFKNKITDDSYLVMSLTKARNGFSQLQNLVRSFPNNKFVLYQTRDNEILTSSEFAIMNENNVVNGQYGSTELRDNFLGIIDDLWKKHLKETPIIIS
jgi:hypothetical protein